MKDRNGKHLTREHYKLLLELGIEIFMYNLKVYDETSTTNKSYGFEIWGSLKEEVDFDELLLLLKVIKRVKDSDSIVIKEMYEQLTMILDLTEDPDERGKK